MQWITCTESSMILSIWICLRTLFSVLWYISASCSLISISLSLWQTCANMTLNQLQMIQLVEYRASLSEQQHRNWVDSLKQARISLVTHTHTHTHTHSTLIQHTMHMNSWKYSQMSRSLYIAPISIAASLSCYSLWQSFTGASHFLDSILEPDHKNLATRSCRFCCWHIAGPHCLK